MSLVHKQQTKNHLHFIACCNQPQDSLKSMKEWSNLSTKQAAIMEGS